MSGRIIRHFALGSAAVFCSFFSHDFASHDSASGAMPITVASEIVVLTQDEFHAMDHRVMGMVFDVHNEFGRLLDEKLFKRALAQRCVRAGLGSVEREVHVRVTHDSFTKDYYMDLLIASGYLMEGKAAETIAPSHRAQTLHYALLAGIRHAKLVNFRPERVQHEFISTTLSHDARRNFRVEDRHWREFSPQCGWLRERLTALLADWGAFLEVSLYRDAIIHFLGGAMVACPPVEILDGDTVLGRQNFCLLTPDTALACTALTQAQDSMGKHLRRLLAHTRWKAVQWANLNHATLELVTLTK